jgi:hypothetical protein
MKELEKRDNDVYRSIFEASPIPDSARAKEIAAALEIESVEKMKREPADQFHNGLS